MHNIISILQSKRSITTKTNLKPMKKQSTKNDIKLTPEELKRLCDYVELLIKIDQRNKKKKARQDAILSLLKTLAVLINSKSTESR